MNDVSGHGVPVSLSSDRDRFEEEEEEEAGIKESQSSVVRCKSLDLKYYFPSPENNFNYFHEDFDAEIKYAYPQEILKKDSLKIVKGMRLEEDIVSLLSNLRGNRDYLVRNNGVKVPVDSITGKYLCICCFSVPLRIEDTAAYACRDMIAAYSHLSANYNCNSNFEMVMVAKMTDDDDEAAFNHFFDAFPCLAIPFWDIKSRDSLCYSLGLTDPREHYSVLVLDPEQTVLQTDADCFTEFGATGFPFDSQRLDALAKRDQEIRFRLDFDSNWQDLELVSTRPPVSLVQLLGSHLLIKSGNGDVVSVSDLSRRSKCVVGLYLCYDGMFMEMLNEVHQTCVSRNLEFEIVLVYMPFHGDSASFVSTVNSALEEKNISSWWLMQFVDEVSRRLLRLCGQLGEDEFIIWAEGGNTGEFQGKEVIWNLGYPFARKLIADDIFSRLRPLTLESLLYHHHHHLIRSKKNGGSKYVPVSELKGRKVLLYVDFMKQICNRKRGGCSSLELVRRYYKRIKKRYPGSEVVYVPLELTYPKNCRPLPPMPWLRLPFQAAIEGSVVDRLFPEDKSPWSSLIAFGEDGLIRSRCVLDRLRDPRCGVSLFADNLYQEIADDLLDFYTSPY